MENKTVTKEITRLVEMLPAEDQNFVYEFVKRTVLAWDICFPHLDESERKRIIKAGKEFQDNNPKEEAALITINEFEKRISVSQTTARIISNQLSLTEKGISVRIKDCERGGVRIHWQRYLDHISSIPVVPDHKRLRNWKSRR